MYAILALEKFILKSRNEKRKKQVTLNKVDSIKNMETIVCFSKFEADPTNSGLDIIKQLSKSET